jgi:hypothetical protein
VNLHELSPGVVGRSPVVVVGQQQVRVLHGVGEGVPSDRDPVLDRLVAGLKSAGRCIPHDPRAVG